eukprot:COSAG01_NODE_596_length_15055_cov_17.624967_4_plen_43_part_00
MNTFSDGVPGMNAHQVAKPNDIELIVREPALLCSDMPEFSRL